MSLRVVLGIMLVTLISAIVFKFGYLKFLKKLTKEIRGGSYLALRGGLEVFLGSLVLLVILIDYTLDYLPIPKDYSVWSIVLPFSGLLFGYLISKKLS